MKAYPHEMGAQMDVVSFPTAGGQRCSDSYDSILVRVSASWLCSRKTGSRTAAAAVHVDMKISILQKYEIIRSVSTVVAAPVNFFAAFKRLISTGAASATPKSRFERLQS